MRRVLRVVLSIAIPGLVVACGGGEEDGAPKIRTTEFGTVILEATDEKTGLLLEIQDDTVYVKLSDGASKAAKALSGNPLGGDCEVDGKGGVRVARRFPIYWRKASGDWGSALARDPINGPGRLVDHVTSCRIFATKPSSRPGTREFDEVNDEPFATIKLR